MRMLRGQSAVEYMMTYGWAILVVLVAGVLLWQLGFLEMSKNIQPDKRGFSQVVPIDWVLQTGGTLTMVLQNNAGTIITLQDAAAGTGANLISGGTGACTFGGLPPDPNMRPGSTQSITFTGCPVEAALTTGEYFRVNVTISYANPSSGLDHKSNGVVWGPLD
jgi:hypothetical protein